MNIVSTSFLIFVSVVILIYSRLGVRGQNVWLLIASYFFYFTWGWEYVSALLAFTVINYWIGLRIGHNLSSGNTWLRVGVVVNVGSLLFLKLISSSYGLTLVNFLGGNISDLGQLEILLPVGFSFYILQAISYLFDVSHGQTLPLSDFVNFSLFLTYFPKMLSGPLERAGQFIPRLTCERKVDNRQFGYGIGLILVGLLRKMVIADGLASIRPQDVISQPAGYSIFEHIVWLVVFAFILYNDFAGYTSIVRGISALMGIELSKNFIQPFFARSFGDFWNRWHVSLSWWLRDYIFYPIRRWSMKKRFPGWMALVIPPMITMLASGYWHGASFAMLAWGGLHGIYQVIEQKFRKKVPSEFTSHRIFSILVVFIFVTFAWVPFTSPGFMDAFAYLRIILPPYRFDFPAPVWINLVTAIFISLGLDWQEYRTTSDSYFLDWPAYVQVISVFVVLLTIILFTGGGPDISNFIYQGF